MSDSDKVCSHPELGKISEIHGVSRKHDTITVPAESFQPNPELRFKNSDFYCRTKGGLPEKTTRVFEADVALVNAKWRKLAYESFAPWVRSMQLRWSDPQLGAQCNGRPIKVEANLSTGQCLARCASFPNCTAYQWSANEGNATKGLLTPGNGTCTLASNFRANGPSANPAHCSSSSDCLFGYYCTSITAFLRQCRSANDYDLHVNSNFLDRFFEPDHPFHRFHTECREAKSSMSGLPASSDQECQSWCGPDCNAYSWDGNGNCSIFQECVLSMTFSPNYTSPYYSLPDLTLRSVPIKNGQWSEYCHRQHADYTDWHLKS